MQIEAPEKTPEKNNDSKGTATEDVGDVGEPVELVPQSTTIGEIPVTPTKSTTPLIVGLTVGIPIGFAIIAIILLLHRRAKGK